MVSQAARRRTATADWMEIEKQRGISVSSTALRFEYEATVFNLLDTPGHHDFSEDTLRVLAAVDSAVILLDAAKGVESQTLRRFEVARERRIPLLTFVNKYDRPGLDPLALLDDIERTLGIPPTARRADEQGREAIRQGKRARVFESADGTLIAAFENEFWLERFELENPGVTLHRFLIR